MTEQQAQIYVERLIKVWGLQSRSQWRLGQRGKQHLLRFSSWINDEVKLEVQQSDKEGVWMYLLVHFVGGQRSGAKLRFYHDELLLGTYINTDERKEEIEREFAAQWLPFFRRGCWLMGCAIKATYQERQDWCASFDADELKTWGVQLEGDDVPDEASLVHEANRVASAFGMESWGRIEELEGQWRHYRGRIQGASIQWRHEWNGTLHLCTIADTNMLAGYCSSLLHIGCSTYAGRSSLSSELLARGLYCLGLEHLTEQLNCTLSTHEKLELRLSMPREFWPQIWLDEEAQ